MQKSYSRDNTESFSLEGKLVVVLGAGRSGVAAANLSVARGARVCLYDSREEVSLQGIHEDIEVYTSATSQTGESVHSDYLVISPGIDTYGEFVRAFQQNAGELLGELELGYRFYDGTCIGITGTNGKTTTTELVAHILNKLGREALPCGNHGVPLSELVLSGAPEYAVVEVSSFQLETISTFRSAVSLWLNLAPDHLDRYPSMEAYREAKARIFEPLLPTDWKVSRKEEGLRFEQNHVTFSAATTEADYHYLEGRICGAEELQVDLQKTRLRGLHNVENAMAAIATVQCLGIEVNVPFEELMAGFAPPAHRCEFIRSLDGVEYINDSKSTNLHSLETALNAFTQPLIVIFGGKNKGLDYSPLKGKLAKNIKLCLSFGEIGSELESLFADEVQTQYCLSLEEAVLAARSNAQKGDYILFSPGTSSFDMYASYVARGEAFRSIVNDLS